MSDYMKLQNGSDIRGIAIDGIEGQIPDLTEHEAEHIAAGFAGWLSGRGYDPAELTVAVGRDPRISGPDLLKGLSRGFAGAGIRMIDCGPASTPAMFMATVFDDIGADASVMITASHLPFNRNGFKFFTGEGGLDKKDIKEILKLAEEHDAKTASVKATDDAGMFADSKATDDVGAAAEAGGTASAVGADICGDNAPDGTLMELYCAHLRKLITDGVRAGERPLEGMKIVVDAGNGGGGFFASEVLAPLGADVSDSCFLEPDGMFPNHSPNPEDRKAMKAVSDRVMECGADLGLIFDTDVDRSAAVDEKGREIARNAIVAMAAALIAEEHPGTTVVTDSVTSDQLTSFLEEDLGLVHLRYKRGYRNVINKAMELNEQGTDSRLAIETSGHAAFKDNYFLDDGAYLAVRIVIKAAELRAKGLAVSEVLADLEGPAEEDEIRIPVTDPDFSAYAGRVLDELADHVRASDGMSLAEPNYEGVRMNFDFGGWCLARRSLHDPVIPVNMASDRAGGCTVIRGILKDFLVKYEGLDLAGLR